MHRNTKNGKLYFGQTCQIVEQRWKNGKGYDKCPNFWNAIIAEGWNNFEHIVLDTELSKEQADEKEKFSSHQLKSSEIDHIKKYRSLDPHGKEMVDFTLLKEWERSTAEPKPESKPSSPTAQIIPMRFLSYYQRMASAGRGEYLFSDIPTEVIPVPDTPLSRRADFVIGVSGRSMEDTYFDGDKVLVEKTQDIPLGKIGIFIRGDECFIKDAGIDRLISHNEDKEQYPDIIPDDRRIDTIGIVLGKVGD